MKVLSFIEIDFRIEGYDNSYLSIMKLLAELNWDGNIKDFYSQPFKPELITELFEAKKLNEFVYTINGFRFIFEEDYFATNLDNRDQWVNEFPRTLDDFINDCQRAGIELTWKV